MQLNTPEAANSLIAKLEKFDTNVAVVKGIPIDADDNQHKSQVFSIPWCVSY